MSAKRSVPRGRRTRSDWITAAWGVLGERATGDVPIAEIARRLGVTKGSFYWHFEGREDFRLAMLEHYREVQTDIVMRAMRDVTGPPARRLRALATFLAKNLDASLERTIYLWADHDPEIARVMEEDHERRIAYVTTLLRDAGWPAPKARFRAMAFAMLMAGWNLTRSGRRSAEIRRYARQIEELFAD